MAAYSKESLYGRWVHSHEEDTDAEMVFRPATHAFPRSRGRASIELRPDGTYLERSPGPDDVPEESRGSWALEGERLVLGAEGERSGHDWEIAVAEDDRLAVRK